MCTIPRNRWACSQVGCWAADCLIGLATQGVFGFCCGIGAIWLMLAATAPAPLPVKNVVYAIPDAWKNRLPDLGTALQAASGVQVVSFSDDGETVFIKALQHGFGEDKVKQILIGE